MLNHLSNNLEKRIECVLLLVAMQAEADPIIAALNLQELAQPADGLPFKAYRNSETGSQKIFALVSGTDPRYGVDNIGTQAATLMAYVGIERFQPDLVISAGTAGGFANKGAQIGTVYLSDEEFIFHDRTVSLPGFDAQGIGNYPAANVKELARQLDLPVGKISSGSSFKKDADQMQLILASGAVAKEMETAAIAWVCWLKQIPLMAVKSVTNLLDREATSEQQFIDNFSAATACLSYQLQRVLKGIYGKTLAQLSA